jgi:predicted Zn-dependent protease
MLHEILHTLGFDHCKAWSCLMNAISNQEGWLCPACSRKLYHELSISSPQAAKQWLREVTKVYS